MTAVGREAAGVSWAVGGVVAARRCARLLRVRRALGSGAFRLVGEKRARGRAARCCVGGRMSRLYAVAASNKATGRA